jgi:cyclopropane fatty-acyl-phospholipid synthase-like methyltransferase
MNQLHAPTQLFRSSWSLYDAVIDGNYMSHQELHGCVRPLIAARAALGNYALLDLGCGNARCLAETLTAFPPVRYVGADLSRAALDGAALALKSLPALELREEDMLRCTEQVRPGSFDLVYSGFAMHHLAAAEKERLFRAVAAALAPGGQFLLVDVLRDERESRETYLHRYLKMIREEWRTLTAEQVAEVSEHVTQHDYPESFPVLADMAMACGLGMARRLVGHGPHQALAFSCL